MMKTEYISELTQVMEKMWPGSQETGVMKTAVLHLVEKLDEAKDYSAILRIAEQIEDM